MYLENVVMDAVDPQALGRFWEAVVGGERLTDVPEGFETRLAVEGGPELDLCFQRVPEPPTGAPRLRLDVSGGAAQDAVVERLLGLGARHADPGQDGPWVALEDLEGNPCRVTPERAAYAGTGPVAALSLDSADPSRDADFWAWLTGWDRVDASDALRHPSLRGPVLELHAEVAPKGDAKNPRHLDLRLETGDDPDRLAAAIAARGGREVQHPEWGELPWRFFEDPSGNEFCLLPARP